MNQSSQAQSSNSGRGGSPNARAGSPQQGGDSPQLSSTTQKKLENAGMGSSKSGGNGVSQEEFDRLVDQNQQIIDLLNDLVDQIKSQNLNSR